MQHYDINHWVSKGHCTVHCCSNVGAPVAPDYSTCTVMNFLFNTLYTCDNVLVLTMINKDQLFHDTINAHHIRKRASPNKGVYNHAQA